MARYRLRSDFRAKLQTQKYILWVSIKVKVLFCWPNGSFPKAVHDVPYWPFAPDNRFLLLHHLHLIVLHHLDLDVVEGLDGHRLWHQLHLAAVVATELHKESYGPQVVRLIVFLGPLMVQDILSTDQTPLNRYIARVILSLTGLTSGFLQNIKHEIPKNQENTLACRYH